MRLGLACVWMPAVLCVLSLSGCKYIFPAKNSFQQARELESAGRYAEAATAYERVYRRHPRSAEGREALSRAAAINEEFLGDWRKAGGLLQDLRIKSEGLPEYPQVMLRLGRVLEKSGSPYREAIAVYSALSQDSTSSPEGVSALLALGRIHESVKSWGEAKNDYRLAIERSGGPERAESVNIRLQTVCLLEVLDAYFGGRIEEAVNLAREGLGQLTVPAVRRGLEDLLRRYRKARKFWDVSAGLVVLEDSETVEEADPERFIIKSMGGTSFRDSGPAPDGWRIEYNDKRRSFVLYEEKESQKEPAWKYESSSRQQVLGYWWAPDGSKLGWIGKWRGGNSMRINVVDLKKKSANRAVYDPSGALLGEVMIFLPRCEKMVFPYRDYLAVADVDGGNQTIFRLRSGPGGAYRSAEADWLACSADGLEVTVGVKGGRAFWKLSLAAGGI